MSRLIKQMVVLHVQIELPRGVSVDRAVGYTVDALASHCGGLDPQDPMFALNRESIGVKLVKKETTYA